MRLRGGRTGVRAVTCEGLELTGLMKPFDLEVFYGERVAVLGSNGSGKSHFLRLLAGERGRRTPGEWQLGARVVPGHFAQTHAHPELAGRTLRRHPVDRARPGPGRGDVARCAATSWTGRATSASTAVRRPAGAVPDPAAGAGRARPCCCSTSRPTTSTWSRAEALEEALEAFDGTVLAVTHDRWFARSFDRFLVFGADGQVCEAPEPVWDERRVERER